MTGNARTRNRAEHLERSAMNHPKPRLGGTSGYEIRTQGHISDRWST
jgi:hypothetical protein